MSYRAGHGFIKTLIEAGSIPLLVQIVTGAILTATPSDIGTLGPSSSTHGGVHFNAVPNEANVFPMVLNEGVVALMILCTGMRYL